MKTFYTSDLHLGHKNICGADGFESTRTRFANPEEMDNYLIDAHNATVSPRDTVYNLGDFAFYSKPSVMAELLMRLNGSIHLIQGNHDSQSKWTKVIKLLENEKVGDKPKLTFYPMGIHVKKHSNHWYLTHVPLDIYLRPKMFSISGHIHSEESRTLNQINVGVDSPLIVQHYGFGTPIEEADLQCIVERRKEEILTLKGLKS